jgi:drug/metabolite transporter (DMT)-like permease
MDRRFAAAFALLCLIWGTTWAAIRVGLRGIPPFTGVAARFAIASAILLAVAPLFGARIGSRGPVERRLWIANGFLSFFASYGIVYWSEQFVPSGLAAVLFATFPLFVALLAHVALPGERLTRAGTLGVLLGFAGVAVIFSEDFSRLGGPGVALAAVVMLGSPIVSAVSNVAIKRWGAGIHPFSLAAVPMGIAAAAMTPVALLLERDRPIVLDVPSVGALLYLAIAGSAVTFTLYYWLMTHLPATRVALIAYVVPVVAVLVGAALGEPVTLKTMAGTALVVSGVALAATSKKAPAPADAGAGRTGKEAGGEA